MAPFLAFMASAGAKLFQVLLPYLIEGVVSFFIKIIKGREAAAERKEEKEKAKEALEAEKKAKTPQEQEDAAKNVVDRTNGN